MAISRVMYGITRAFVDARTILLISCHFFCVYPKVRDRDRVRD